MESYRLCSMTRQHGSATERRECLLPFVLRACPSFDVARVRKDPDPSNDGAEEIAMTLVEVVAPALNVLAELDSTVRRLKRLSGVRCWRTPGPHGGLRFDGA